MFYWQHIFSLLPRLLNKKQGYFIYPFFLCEHQKISTEIKMNIVMSNPGFSHIAQNVIWRLDQKSQLNCRMVDQSWKAQVDQPYFWIKKLDCEKGQSKDLTEAWIDLAGKIEKG